MRILILLSLIFCLIISCGNPKEDTTPILQVVKEEKQLSTLPLAKMSRYQLYDKILGTLTGSAIGDAMGAPTEMWSRKSIKVEFGFVDSLDNLIREPSPEGTWDYNLPIGGTTDDTRWKFIMGHFLINQASTLYAVNGISPKSFAQYIVNQYSSEVEAFKKIDSFDPAPFEQGMRRMSWLQEWAIVAKPYVENRMEDYQDAISKFYGGEMVCAGILYAPLIGAMYPGAPDLAYNTAYRLSIFDLGYARDITALTAALVAVAMSADVHTTEILEVLRNIDPKGYFKSRLVGRSSYKIYRDAIYIVDAAKRVDEVDEKKLMLTKDNQDSLYLTQLQAAYDLLDEKNQDYPFHAGEIHLINLTALLFANFDFRNTLNFVINYGRDNDTVGAVTGAILGAFYGFDRIPSDLKTSVLKTNKEKLGIDLELLAEQITDTILEQKAVVAF